MLNIRPILFILGLLLTTLALAMSIPALIDALTGHSDWQVFLASAGLTMFIGISLILTMRGSNMAIGIRDAFILTIGSWLGVTLFASLPFAFAELNLSFADAFFEDK